MQYLDPSLARPLPFFANMKAPRVEYEFKTDVFTSESGKEQRMMRREAPRVSVQFDTTVHGAGAISRAMAFMNTVGDTAVIVPDFRLMGQAKVIAQNTIQIVDNVCQWPVGTNIVIYFNGEGVGSGRVTQYDPVTSVIQIDEETTAPIGDFVTISSCDVGSVKEVKTTVYGSETFSFDVEATIYRAEKSLLTVSTPLVFPRPLSELEPHIEFEKPTRLISNDTGPIYEFRDTANRAMGRRLIEVDCNQINHTQKEQLIAFFHACRGRQKSFTLPPGVVPGDRGKRYRFASDILSIEHSSSTMSRTTVRLLEVIL